MPFLTGSYQCVKPTIVLMIWFNFTMQDQDFGHIVMSFGSGINQRSITYVVEYLD
eukprot:TRINITY_DN10735_c0_g1_i1.p2 TRINITY_DN10735_c0_g1~~TRINITY_DN10735_c0_g1_i1.p2  ORF type:complete len:55 (+),score=0.69 TRINITY_DN10735_c0_g1_i1:137-301(+)